LHGCAASGWLLTLFYTGDRYSNGDRVKERGSWGRSSGRLITKKYLQ
jgi:hypothetical protein